MIKRLDYRFFGGGGGAKARAEDDSQGSSQSDTDLSDDESDASSGEAEQSDSAGNSAREAGGSDSEAGDSDQSEDDEDNEDNAAELANGSSAAELPLASSAAVREGKVAKATSEKALQKKAASGGALDWGGLRDTKAVPSKAARARLAGTSLEAVAEERKAAKGSRKQKLEPEQQGAGKRSLQAIPSEPAQAEGRVAKGPAKKKKKSAGTERHGAEEAGKGGGGEESAVLRSEASWKSQWADAVDSDDDEGGPRGTAHSDDEEEDAASDEERDGQRWLLMKMGGKGSTFRCRVCPSVVCLNEGTAAAHLESKKHKAAVKRWKSGTINVMLNSDGEAEEDGETHAERIDRLSKTTAEQANKKKRKKQQGRQRQRNRQKLKQSKPEATT